MSESTGNLKANPAAIVAMTIIACTGIAGAVVLIMAGKGVGDLLAVLAVVAVPVLTLFGGHIYTKLDDIKTISNGNTAAMRDAMIAMAQTQQSANLGTPPPPTVPDAP